MGKFSCFKTTPPPRVSVINPCNKSLDGLTFTLAIFCWRWTVPLMGGIMHQYIRQDLARKQNLKLFGTSETFRDIWNFSGHLKLFGTSETFCFWKTVSGRNHDAKNCVTNSVGYYCKFHKIYNFFKFFLFYACYWSSLWSMMVSICLSVQDYTSEAINNLNCKFQKII